MRVLKAKVIDDMHLELEKRIETKSGEIFIRIIEKKLVRELRGAWGYDIDSAEFEEHMRKSRTIEDLEF